MKNFQASRTVESSVLEYMDGTGTLLDKGVVEQKLNYSLTINKRGELVNVFNELGESVPKNSDCFEYFNTNKVWNTQ